MSKRESENERKKGRKGAKTREEKLWAIIANINAIYELAQGQNLYQSTLFTIFSQDYLGEPMTRMRPNDNFCNVFPSEIVDSRGVNLQVLSKKVHRKGYHEVGISH